MLKDGVGRYRGPVQDLQNVRTCEPVGPDRSRSTGAAIDCSSEFFPWDGENVIPPASFDFLLISYASE